MTTYKCNGRRFPDIESAKAHAQLVFERTGSIVGIEQAKTKNTYLFEVTDTFGGDANYSWVRRYTVHATSMSGALRMVNREEGFGRLTKVTEDRWDVPGCCICILGSDHEGEPQGKVLG